MIDWFSGYIGYDASQLELGKFFVLDSKGEVIRSSDRWETAKGSWESGVQVTRGAVTADMLSYDPACPLVVLRISGNPSKYLQGHNVDGPSVADLGPVMQAVVRSFGEGLRPVDADKEQLAAVQRSRVDVTTSVWMLDPYGRAPSHDAVHAWLHEAGKRTRSRHGRAIDSKGTVYWGQNSTRWSMKAYCKHCELKDRPPEVPEALYHSLKQWTYGQLRIELTLRRPELKDRGPLDESIIWEYLNRVEGLEMKVQQFDMAKLDLPNSAKSALLLWRAGEDVKCVQSHAMFYRSRRAVLAATGIDISIAADEQEIRAKPALVGLDVLREREVQQSEMPDRIQRSLFGAGK